MGTGGKGISLETKTRPLPELGGGPSLYVHVPFCRSKCGYCDFYSLPAGPGSAPGKGGEAFLENLEKEWALLGEPGPFATIYVGGGTPTVLDSSTFFRLLDFLAPLLARGGEWTVEANPESLDAEKVQAMKEAGVTRLSLGIQSLREEDLAFLGRAHDSRKAREALDLARRQGPGGLSADLILGLPGQEEKDLEEEIPFLLDRGVEHLSFYILTLEEGTPLHERARRGEISLPAPAAQARILLFVRAFLASRGLPPYEISNAAIPGRECRHNLRYWLGGEYLGLGPSAASFTAGKRRKNLSHLGGWAAALGKSRLPVEEEESLPPLLRAGERAWLQLRTRWGMDPAEVRERTGAPSSWVEKAEDLASFFRDRGLMEKSENRWALTEAGILQADGIGAAFLALD